MITTLLICSSVLIILNILPLFNNQHWIFRVPDFMKVQLTVIQLILFVVCFFYLEESLWFYIVEILHFISILYHASIIIRYTKIWKTPIQVNSRLNSEPIHIISCNIYQYNTHYDLFIDMIRKQQPDIFLTMESNLDWERSMRVLEKDYPYTHKVTLENTYGMHLYSKIPFNKVETHYFVADDLPSIEAKLTTSDGFEFVFFGVHPPPPSPTEEANSKERDGDLFSVAKRLRNYELPIIVMGDFNTVAWARASKLFRKTSELIDARIGRGILASFHAKYWFFRIPLDLLFHSPSIFIDELKILPNIKSDHFPVSCKFYMNLDSEKQEKEVETLEAGEMKIVNELIQDGIEEESDNRKEE